MITTERIEPGIVARKTTRILLADDHTILRKGLRMLLETAPGLEVVGEAADGVEAIRMAQDLKPDLVLMDVSMPRINGIEATEEIKRHLPATKIIVLSMHESDEYLFKAVKVGGSGYVHKKAAETELLDAIKEVMRGGTYLRETATMRLAQDVVERFDAGEAGTQVESLTPREKDVLRLIATGLTNQEIADKLIISIRTVETHRAHIIDKLGIRKRSELVHYALRKGLVD